MDSVLLAIWFFSPAAIANTAPVFANNIPLTKNFAQPLDFGKTFRGKPVFGKNKTFRGLLSGILFGAFVGCIQIVLFRNIDAISNFTIGLDYGSFWAILLGASLGFGALAGDAVESFFKRQLNIAPGKSWPVFDQIDLILGASVMSLLFVTLPWHIYVIAIIFILLIHPVMNILAWLARLQPNPF